MIYKKLIKIILLYLFLITKIIGYAASDSKENAADYYLRSWNLMKYPQELHEKIVLTVKNGFKSNENRLKQLLIQNEDAFKEFKKGVILSNCDFSSYKKQNKKDVIDFGSARSFIFLLLLQGRFHESNDNLNEAADSYISSLTLIKHISQDATQKSGLITYVVQAAFIDIMYLPLKDLLGSKKVSKPSVRKILAALNNYEKDSLTLEKVIQYEQQLFKNESVQDGLKYLRKDKLTFSEKDISIFEKEANKLADEYYGYYIKAVKTEQQRDWDILKKKITELNSDNLKTIARALDIIVTSSLSREKGVEKSARFTLKVVLARALPSPDRIQSIQFKYLAQIKDLKTLAAHPVLSGKHSGTFVSISPMVELDGKTKAEIYRIRNGAVASQPQLVRLFGLRGYRPSDAVFGEIGNGKPWWGILGVSYYGPGEHGIDGPSEESRYLMNPFMLVGVDESKYYPAQPIAMTPLEVYPESESLQWDLVNRVGWVTYKMSAFFEKVRLLGFPPNMPRHEFTFIAYNARDLGFPYLYPVPEKSNGVSLGNKPGNIIQHSQFIHVGNSCGYPGGCNNMSPFSAPLEFTVNMVPARIPIKLWRKAPADIKAPADAWFIIEMI